MSNYERKERGESYVLVLYTGGTIGMMRNENNGKALDSFVLSP